MLVVLGSLERLWALLSIGTLVAIGVIAERAVPAFAAACGSGVAYSGSGTAVDPYLISEADHLIYLSQTTSDWSGKYFSQTADVDLEDCSFSPIGLHNGGFGDYFTGTYNGVGTPFLDLPFLTPHLVSTRASSVRPMEISPSQTWDLRASMFPHPVTRQWDRYSAMRIWEAVQ